MPADRDKRLLSPAPPREPPAPAGLYGAGLDVSLTGTGVCVLGAGTDGADQYRMATIHTAPGDFANPYERIDHIADAVLFHLPPATASVTVAVEETFIHPERAASNHALVAVGFMVRRALTRAGYAWFNVHNAHLKRYVAGTGKAKKADMQRDVLWRWRIKTADDNQADAAGLAHIARAIAMIRRGQNPEVWNPADREVLLKIGKGKP